MSKALVPTSLLFTALSGCAVAPTVVTSDTHVLHKASELVTLYAGSLRYDQGCNGWPFSEVQYPQNFAQEVFTPPTGKVFGVTDGAFDVEDDPTVGAHSPSFEVGI